MFNKFIYKWLPITFGCHCRKERSFHYKGRKLPVCARCTGELIGIILSILLSSIFIPPVEVSILLMIPMVVDGVVQLKTNYESNNIRRLITGIMFGYSLVNILIITTVATFNYGKKIGQLYF